MPDLTKKLRSYNPTSGYSRVMRLAADAIETLEAENERLSQDAERYRWLRDRGTQYALMDAGGQMDIWCNTPKQLDAAIDAALRGEVE